MLYSARWKRITVDQSKVLKNWLFPFFFWGGGGGGGPPGIFSPPVIQWKLYTFLWINHSHCEFKTNVYRVAPKNGTVDTVIFSGLCSDQCYLFFTLLDRASFPHYNNTKIIKFGWELFILWAISYGLSFSRFAQICPEFWGTINEKWMANPENDSP